MKQILHYQSNSFIFMILIFALSILSIPLGAQTVTIKGEVTASRLSVKNASVTFIDNSDTTVKYSTLTDASGNYQIDLVITSINNKNNSLPAKFKLEQNYPNPFTSTTSIPYNLNKESDVHVTIYDILGRVVRRFNVSLQSAGLHNILWDGRNNLGEEVASGVYFYRLSADGESQVKKMIFNQNGNGSIALSHSYSIGGNVYLGKEDKTGSIQGNTFTVRIQSIDATSPLIVSQELENVVINNDTTINISATYIPEETVNLDSLHQIIRGFGATNLFFFGRPDMTNSEINTAFGTGDGQLGFTILRMGIDVDSTNWSSYISTAKKAYNMGATIIASPWYAPTNMTETVNGYSMVQPSMYGEYVAYLNSFYRYMQNNGVPIYGISVQNEPDSKGSGWTIWTADEMFAFMKGYADSITGPKVMAPESFHFDTSYSGPILRDSAATANTDIVCGHIYGVQPTKLPLAEEKGKEVWMTEYLINSGNPPSNLSIDTGWTGAMQTAQSINDCMNSDMSAYVYWYLVRYYGPISDGTYTTAGQVTKKGYVMSQFARFIRPGYHRVASSVYPSISNVEVTAYKDSSSSKVVIVAINPGSTQTESVVKVQNLTQASSFTPYVTSTTKNAEQGNSITVTNGAFTAVLEPSSITTFVSN
jgi:glucuronoarabinoxylan endo-1,4-beta-xylanase